MLAPRKKRETGILSDFKIKSVQVNGMTTAVRLNEVESAKVKSTNGSGVLLLHTNDSSTFDRTTSSCWTILHPRPGEV